MTALIQKIIIGLSAAALGSLRKEAPINTWLGCLHNLLLNIAGNMKPEEWQLLAASNQPCGRPQCTCHEDLGRTLEALQHLRTASDKMKAGKVDDGDSFIPAHLRG